MVNNVGGKNLICQGKKILSPDYSCNSITQSKSPIPPCPSLKSQMVDPLNIFMFYFSRSCSDSEQMYKSVMHTQSYCFANRSPVKTDATLLANNSQHFWELLRPFAR